jgi:hypothetical protein
MLVPYFLSTFSRNASSVSLESLTKHLVVMPNSSNSGQLS